VDEGRLLSGQASMLSERWFPSGGSACRAKASPVGRQIFAEPGPPLGELGARELLEHFTRDVALQDPDHLAFGAALLRPAFHVGARARVG